MKILVKFNVVIIKLFTQKYVKIIISFHMMVVLIVNSLVHYTVLIANLVNVISVMNKMDGTYKMKNVLQFVAIKSYKN